MKISELIEKLQKVKDEHGDLDCITNTVDGPFDLHWVEVYDDPFNEYPGQKPVLVQ